jgi:hypothetical protein
VSDVREAGQSVTLRPGIVLPVIGSLGSVVMAALSFVAVTFPGPHNHSLFARWLGGQVLAVAAWALYKLASNRIVLGEESMRIVSWGQTWTVRRGGVAQVELTDEAFSLAITLTDGLVITPFMFVASPAGVGYFRAGLFRNSMSRETIAARITEWNAQFPGARLGQAPGTRQLRLNLPLLLIASAVVAAMAISLTAANLWW